MSRTLSRVAAGTLGLIIAAAGVNVATALAQQAPTTPDGNSGPPAISTSCGTGTLEWCADKDSMKCEWEFSVSFKPSNGSVPFFEVKIKTANCVKTGSIPQYKDRMPDRLPCFPTNGVSRLDEQPGYDGHCE